MPHYYRARIIQEILFSVEDDHPDPDQEAATFGEKLGEAAVEGIMSDHADMHLADNHVQVDELAPAETDKP